MEFSSSVYLRLFCYFYIHLYALFVTTRRFLINSSHVGTEDDDWEFHEFDEYGNKNNQSVFDRRIDGDFTVWQTGSRLTEEGIR